MAANLREFLSGLATDPRLLAEFLADPDAAMKKAGLAKDDRKLLRGGDPAAIHARIAGSQGGAPPQAAPGQAPATFAGAWAMPGAMANVFPSWAMPGAVSNALPGAWAMPGAMANVFPSWAIPGAVSNALPGAVSNALPGAWAMPGKPPLPQGTTTPMGAFVPPVFQSGGGTQGPITPAGAVLPTQGSWGVMYALILYSPYPFYYY